MSPGRKEPPAEEAGWAQLGLNQRDPWAAGDGSSAVYKEVQGKAPLSAQRSGSLGQLSASPQADEKWTSERQDSRGTRPAEGRSLDLHGEISHPRFEDDARCKRWPEHFQLVNQSTGELVKGRCRSTNLCDYCAKLMAVENSEALALDAVESGNAPAIWMVLTTRTATVEAKRFYKSRECLMRAIKRRWPDAQYAALVEFTTGYGKLSRGLRRPHWNVLLKSVPADGVDELRQVVTDVWCAREDAEPLGQYVGAVSEVGGLMRYIALHFQKESQAPPTGWRGHRFIKSRDYFGRPMPEVRAEAQRSLRLKRLIHRGLDAVTAELELERAEAVVWSFIQVKPGSWLNYRESVHGRPRPIEARTA